MLRRSSEFSGAFFHATVFLLTIEGLHPPSEKITVRCAGGGGDGMPKSGCVHSTASPREDGQRRSGWRREGDYLVIHPFGI